MSFNQGASSGSLSFKPARFDVEWDGVSEAKASFQLACQGTCVSYAAKAYRVFSEDGAWTCGVDQYTSVVPYSRGERFFTVNSSCVKTFSGDVNLSATVSNGVATIVFSGVPNTTHVYAWQLTATKGASSRVVIAGKLEAKEPNPYAPGASTISLVSGVTASGCL